MNLKKDKEAYMEVVDWNEERKCRELCSLITSMLKILKIANQQWGMQNLYVNTF